MPGPEAIVERTICREAKAAGYIVRKLRFLDANGAQDHIFGRDGETIAIEFKKLGKEPTEQQEKRAKEMREAFGWKTYACDNIPLGRKILNL